MKPRDRRLYLLAIPVVIAAGLASRHLRDQLPTVIYLYAGDALWASCVPALADRRHQTQPDGVVAQGKDLAADLSESDAARARMDGYP